MKGLIQIWFEGVVQRMYYRKGDDGRYVYLRDGWKEGGSSLNTTRLYNIIYEQSLVDQQIYYLKLKSSNETNIFY